MFKINLSFTLSLMCFVFSRKALLFFWWAKILLKSRLGCRTCQSMLSFCHNLCEGQGFLCIFSSVAVARISGLKQNVCCVKSPVAGSLSAIVIFLTWQTSLLKSPKSRLQLPLWWVMLHLYIWHFGRMHWDGETVTHATFSPITGYTSGFCLRNSNTMRFLCKEQQNYQESYPVISCVYDFDVKFHPNRACLDRVLLYLACSRKVFFLHITISVYLNNYFVSVVSRL